MLTITALGVAPETMRRTLRRHPAGPLRRDRGAHPVRRERAKKVLELTFRQALRLGHNYVGTEHILLALLEHEDGAGTLTGLGLDREAVEGHVVRMLSSLSGAPEDPGTTQTP